MLQRIRGAPPRYWLVGVVVLFLVGFPTVISSFLASEWAQALILAIAIMGLNILVGYSGQLSLGHGAFMALGAYTSAILAHHFKMDIVATIPIAGLLTGLVGFVLPPSRSRWSHQALSSDRPGSPAACRGSSSPSPIRPGSLRAPMASSPASR